MTVAAEPSLLDPGLIADPYGGYSRLREEAPVLLGKRSDGGPAWYVTRHDDVRRVLSDPRFVVNPASIPGMEVPDIREKLVEILGIPANLAGYLTNSILDADGAGHTRVRKLVAPAFTARRAGRLRPRIEETTKNLLDLLGDPAELITEFAYPFAVTVICDLVGVPETERDNWRRWGAALQPPQPGAAGPALQEMVEYAHGLVERRRTEPADDLITELLQARDDGDRLTETEVVAAVLAVVLSGQETTAHLVGNATYALLSHPDQLEMLRRDPSRWPGAVRELMRWCGPIQLTRLRYAAVDVELGDTLIRTGDAVQAVLVSANYDPRQHQDPERLDLTRRPTERGDGHLGFGHGFHYCVGAALARQEGEVALRGLFERFPRLTLVSDTPEWVPQPGMRRLAHLRLHPWGS